MIVPRLLTHEIVLEGMCLLVVTVAVQCEAGQRVSCCLMSVLIWLSCALVLLLGLAFPLGLLIADEMGEALRESKCIFSRRGIWLGPFVLPGVGHGHEGRCAGRSKAVS